MDYVDFGRYLTRQRELRGMSVTHVADATKIPTTLISALESGQAERLPSKVFVVNYVRAYARVIGLEAEEAVLRYEEVVKTQAAPSPQTLERARKKKALVTLAGVTAIGTVVAYVAWRLLSLPG